MHLDLRVEVSRNFYWDRFTYIFLFLDQQLISTLISIFEWYFSTLNNIFPDWYTGCTFCNWYWKLIPSYIFFFLGQPLISAFRKQAGYKFGTCLNSRWVVILRSTRNLWKPLYSSIGFECHQFNLNATTPPNKARFTLLEAWISSWSFASLNINNLSWWDGGHVQGWVSEKNSITFGKYFFSSDIQSVTLNYHTPRHITKWYNQYFRPVDLEHQQGN